MESLEAWELHPEELRAAAAMKSTTSRLTFLGGRVALRRALRAASEPLV